MTDGSIFMVCDRVVSLGVELEVFTVGEVDTVGNTVAMEEA